MTLEDAIILIDAQIEAAPLEIRDDWRVVRGHLRRARRPSSVSLPAVDPDDVPTDRHFRVATRILDEASKGAETKK